MPPEPSPWDRKDFFKERKHERSSESVGFVSRWRDTPHHGSSSREFARWGSAADFRSRTPGHVKQGGWHNYSEESGHGFTPSRSNEKILDDESCRPSGTRVDGKYSRNSRENRGSFSHKDWKGHTWENGASPNGPGRPHDVNDQRSVNEMLMYNSHSHSDFVNTWDQFHIKDQHDKTRSFNGSGTGQRFERENSLGSIDWKPLKWTRSGSLSSRGSGFSHSSSSKSLGVDSIEAKAEVQLRNVTPIQSPSGDAVVCATSTTPSEETSSRKKPRLKWGEGLAKYEKKKVEGPDDGEIKHGTVISGNTESLHLQVSSLSDKSPRVTGFSDCASPATPSSVACSSSPGIDDKPSIKVPGIDNDTINLSGSPHLSSQNHVEGVTFNLENLELAAIANLSSSISELLQSDDPGSVDSSYVRSTAMNKLLVWKGGFLKALEMTESEIDTLENELKTLISESGNSHSRAAGSSSFQGEDQVKPCGELVTRNVITRPAPLQIVSSGDVIVEKAVGGLEEEHGQVKDEDLDSPGTVTSKFVEPLSEVKTAARSDVVEHDDSSGDLDASESKNQELKCSDNCFNAEKIEGSSNSDGCGRLTASKSYADTPVRVNLQSEIEEELYDVIMASNRDSANRASEVFNKLLSSDQGHDVLKTSLSSWHNDPLIKEKYAVRKRFLRFKERAIILKFRAFQHLWKEDMRLLSMRKYRAKSQKRLELGSRILHGSYQKHRSSIRSRFASPAGNLSLVPTTEIINFTSKLLSDSQVKNCRNSLKMPAMILDKKERMISRFISNNGLVEDPCAIEMERAMINPWTTEERGIFMDKLATFGKDFRKIASFLDHKTTADCVEFYYKNHKSDCFVKTKKSEFAKEGKSCSANNYLVTSGKRWNREANAASLDMLGAASAIAANADDDVAIQQKCRGRFLLGPTSDCRVPRGDGVLERSGSIDIFSNDRETVAADVLAGICGSLSSEAMSSCITSSFDPGESYQDWKCQKVGSLKRRPLTPEVTQNVDDDTCSDESCGEMDPADWTDEEKSIFIQAVSSYGKDFTMISRCVRTRSRDQCKVFFSKARKCLGLDMIQPRPVNEGMPTSDDAPGGGSDNEDACFVETGSVSCSEKPVSKVDEDMMLSDLNTNHFEYDPGESMNIQTDLNLSKENNDTGRIGGKDTEHQSEDMVTADWQEEGNRELDVDGDGKMENGFGGVSVLVQDHENAVLSLGNEAGGDGATDEGTSSGESLLVKEANDHGLSLSGTELETMAIGQEQEGQQLVTGNNVSDKQDGNGETQESGPASLNDSEQDLHMNRRASDIAADTNASVGFGVDPKQEEKIAMEFDPTPEPCVPSVVSLQQDASLVNVNSLIKGPQPSQYVKSPSTDVAATLDFEKISDKHCDTSARADDCNQHQSGRSGFGQTSSGQILKGYPLQVSTKEEMNGDVGSKKLASLQSFSKVDRNSLSDMYLSKECLLQKCNGSKGSLAVELPFLSQEQKSDYSRPPSGSSIDAEKPSRNGDVKLFGQILTHPSAQQKPNASVVHENEDKGLTHPKLSSKNLNMKFSGIQSVDGNSVPAKLDRNNYLGIENVPVRSYGYWDGNRIQTGFSSLPDSAILLAKYPAAFGSYSTSSSSMEQQPLCSLVKSNEHNFNSSSVFSNREISSSNGVADHLFYRNREGGGRVSPFTVDMKQRQDILFSEMQRRSGFDGVSGMQQQGRMGGLNVVGRGGILVGGGACTGVSDPVAAIKMHYAKTEQFGGQTASIVREEESWRGKGDIGR